MSGQTKTPKKRLRELHPEQLLPGELPKTPSAIKREGYTRIPSQPLMRAPCMSHKARNMSPNKRASESPRKPRPLLKCTPDQNYLLSPRKQRNAMSVSPIRPSKSASAAEVSITFPVSNIRDMEVSPIKPSTTSAGRARERGQEERPYPSTSSRSQGNRRIFPTYTPLQLAHTPTSTQILNQGPTLVDDHTTALSETANEGENPEPLFLRSDSDDECL